MEPEPDGCDLIADGTPTPDDRIDAVVLFAGLDEEDAVAVRAAEWEALFNEGHTPR